MPDVVINFATAGDANVARAFATGLNAIREQNKQLDAAYRANTRLDLSMTKMAKNMQQGMVSIAGGLKSVALGIVGGGGILGAWSLWKSANEEILQQAHETSLAYDDLFRKFNIQSGLRGMEGKAAKEEILNVAERRAVTEETAAKGMTQLISSGLPVDEVVKGGAGDEFLQGLNAMNQRGAGVDATGLAAAAASFMNAMGVQKNAAGMRETMSSLYATFLGTNIQLPDMQQYAAKAGGMKGKLTFKELMAAGSIHRDLGIQSAESASGLEGLVSQAGTAGASNDKVEALKSIGLKPTDIDFIGENLDTVLGRLQSGLNTIPEEQRESVMKKVFEQSGVKFLKPLLESRGTIQERISAMDNADYAGAVAESERGPNAAAVRQDVAQRRRREKSDQLTQLRIRELVAMSEEAGYSPANIQLSKTEFESNISAGFSPKAAAQSAFGKTVFGQGFKDPLAEADRRLKAKGIEFPATTEPGERHVDLELTPEQRKEKRLNEAKAKLNKAQRDVERHQAGVLDPRNWFDSHGAAIKRRDQAKGELDRLKSAGGNGDVVAELKDLKTLIASLVTVNVSQLTTMQQGRGPLPLETPPAPTDSYALSQ